jgi:hypothetical protein
VAADAIDKLIMSAGESEVTVGDADFDRRFVIQSRDEAVVNVLAIATD